MIWKILKAYKNKGEDDKGWSMSHVELRPYSDTLVEPVILPPKVE